MCEIRSENTLTGVGLGRIIRATEIEAVKGNALICKGLIQVRQSVSTSGSPYLKKPKGVITAFGFEADLKRYR